MSTLVVIVKKECFNREGMFDERLLCHEDWELWLRISKYYEFKYIDEPSVNLYFTSDSISFNLNNSIEDRKLILNKHLEEFRKNQKSLARYFFHIGVDLCLSNKPKQARGYFLKSLKTHPFNIKFLPTVLISLFIPALCIKTIKLYAEAKGKFINFITSLTRGSGYENRY